MFVKVSSSVKWKWQYLGKEVGQKAVISKWFHLKAFHLYNAFCLPSCYVLDSRGFSSMFYHHQMQGNHALSSGRQGRWDVVSIPQPWQQLCLSGTTLVILLGGSVVNSWPGSFERQQRSEGESVSSDWEGQKTECQLCPKEILEKLLTMPWTPVSSSVLWR